MATENFPLGDRIEALNSSAAWLPEDVLDRIVQALVILPHTGMSPGPSRLRGSYPPALIAAAAARDSWLRRNVPSCVLQSLAEPVSHTLDDAGDGDARTRYAADLPSALDLSRMAEALAWPMKYLADHPLQSDALLLFCMGQAYRRFEINPILKERREAAALFAWASASSREDKIAAAAIAKGIDPEMPGFDQLPVDVRLPVLAHSIRVGIAKQVAAAINRKLANGQRPFEEIRNQGRRDFMRRCREAQAAPEGADDLIGAMPGKCLHRWQVDRNRKRALEIIASGLRRNAVEIR